MSFTFITMVFLALFDDFVLQPIGFLCNMKQKRWWESNAPDMIYRYDYICALILHSFCWTFMMMIPVFLTTVFSLNYEHPILVYVLFIINILIHAIVDHMKANKRVISLVQDQIMHLLQICITFILLCA